MERAESWRVEGCMESETWVVGGRLAQRKPQVLVRMSGESSGAEVDDSGEDKWIPPPHNGGAVGVYDQMPDRAGGYCLYIFYSNSSASVPVRSFSDCITSTLQAHSPASIPFSVLKMLKHTMAMPSCSVALSL